MLDVVKLGNIFHFTKQYSCRVLHNNMANNGKKFSCGRQIDDACFPRVYHNTPPVSQLRFCTVRDRIG